MGRSSATAAPHQQSANQPVNIPHHHKAPRPTHDRLPLSTKEFTSVSRPETPNLISLSRADSAANPHSQMGLFSDWASVSSPLQQQSRNGPDPFGAYQPLMEPLLPAESIPVSTGHLMSHWADRAQAHADAGDSSHQSSAGWSMADVQLARASSLNRHDSGGPHMAVSPQLLGPKGQSSGTSTSESYLHQKSPFAEVADQGSSCCSCERCSRGSPSSTHRQGSVFLQPPEGLCPCAEGTPGNCQECSSREQRRLLRADSAGGSGRSSRRSSGLRRLSAFEQKAGPGCGPQCCGHPPTSAAVYALDDVVRMRTCVQPTLI